MWVKTLFPCLVDILNLGIKNNLGFRLTFNLTINPEINYNSNAFTRYYYFAVNSAVKRAFNNFNQGLDTEEHHLFLIVCYFCDKKVVTFVLSVQTLVSINFKRVLHLFFVFHRNIIIEIKYEAHSHTEVGGYEVVY